ncbi:MAG: MarR family winged helix-turn-helix transcriptional regulator, partial [Solirubrobacteraceae bacterium]
LDSLPVQVPCIISAVVPRTANPALVASDLRVVLGQLVRRLRAEHRFPLSHGAVLGRLDRDGPQGTSDLALAERVRPQSMAQTLGDLEADDLIARRRDPDDGRRVLIELSEAGREALEQDRRHREGWLARSIDEELSDDEQEVLAQAVELLQRLSRTDDR